MIVKRTDFTHGGANDVTQTYKQDAVGFSHVKSPELKRRMKRSNKKKKKEKEKEKKFGNRASSHRQVLDRLYIP
jgi:hypothetical protein